MSYSIPSVGLLESVSIVELRSPWESPVVSLEDRLIRTGASAAVDSAGRVNSIQRILESPDITHPERLAKLQEEAGQHTVDINLINVLVRKSVGTVETLMRS